MGINGSFRLRIERYAYEGEHLNRWDANWMRIGLDAAAPQGSWQVSDPLLLSWEIEELAEWLEAVARSLPAEPVLGFVEPNLRFELRERAGAARSVRIHFDLEAKPPWLKRSGDDECFIDFTLASAELLMAARSLRAQLGEWPMRLVEDELEY